MAETNMNAGYVYLMRNRSMPTRVKIGFTMGDPMDRANELSTATGVPEPFEVVEAIATPWPREVEAEVHRQLDRLRVSRIREFFEAGRDSMLHIVSDDEINQYYMLIIKQSVEQVELSKRSEALRTEDLDMRARHVRQLSEFIGECMKKNSPEDYEKMLQRFKQYAEREGGRVGEDCGS